jgi:hypothetical protein
MNCYIRTAKSAMIEEWKKGRMLNHVGLSEYTASGSHVYGDKKNIAF